MPDQSSIPAQFIVYAALFRLLIVGAGVAFVTFGYRLLSKAVDANAKSSGAVTAAVGKAHLTLKNLAPGTMFAAFGAVIIAVMLYQGMPALSQKNGTGEVVLRGDKHGSDNASIETLTERASNLERAGNLSGATDGYEESLDHLAIPMNNLALLYLKADRNSEALGLAQIAAGLRPYRADILDTLAWAYDRNGNHSEALRSAERAARFDPAFGQRLDALRRGEKR